MSVCRAACNDALRGRPDKWSEELQIFVTDAEIRSAQATAACRAASRSAWKRGPGTQGQARQKTAFAYIRRAGGTATTSIRSTCSELDAQRQQWSSRWVVSGTPSIAQLLADFDLRIGNVVTAPVFTQADVLRSSKSFPHDTAGGPDGLHVRQAALLPESALQFLADGFSIFAVNGAVATRASYLTNPLIPKPTGGFRPIGVLSSWLRLFGGAAAPWGKDWAVDFATAHPDLAAGPGRSSIQPVWRAAARAQIMQCANLSADPQALQLCGVTVLLDVEKFFDTVPIDRMIESAVRSLLPLWMIRAALTCYSLPRHLRVAGCIAPGITPTTGVVAGDATAMHIVSSIMADVLSSCEFDISVDILPVAYVDDVQAMLLTHRHCAVAQAVHMGATLRKAITDYGLTVNATKTVVTCDHRPTAVAVALRLGAPVLHKHMYRARSLGIDHSVLRPRRRGAGAARAVSSPSAFAQPIVVWCGCAASVELRRAVWGGCSRHRYGQR